MAKSRIFSLGLLFTFLTKVGHFSLAQNVSLSIVFALFYMDSSIKIFVCYEEKHSTLHWIRTYNR